MSLLLSAYSGPSIHTASTPLTSVQHHTKTQKPNTAYCSKVLSLCQKPWFNLLLYAIIVYITALFGGLIFHAFEYQHERKQIQHRRELYENIKSLLPNTSYHEQLDELLNMPSVPLSEKDNRWTIGSSIFFAFTTMSTIGYGYVAPDTFGGRMATFVYVLPSMLIFRAQIANVVQFIGKKSKKSELKMLIVSIALLLGVLCQSGLLLSFVEKEWNYMDGLYFVYTSITTIGYGDLQPNQDTEVWLLFVIWIGVILTFAVIGFAQDYVVNKRHKRKRISRSLNSYSSNSIDWLVNGNMNGIKMQVSVTENTKTSLP